jgi:hypothetical protein
MLKNWMKLQKYYNTLTLIFIFTPCITIDVRYSSALKTPIKLAISGALEQQTHRLVSRANSARKIANHSSLTSAELVFLSLKNQDIFVLMLMIFLSHLYKT